MFLEKALQMKKNAVNRILIIGEILLVLEIALGIVFQGVFHSSYFKKYSELSTRLVNEETEDLAEAISSDLTSARNTLQAAVSVAGGEKSTLASAKFLGAVAENLPAGFVAYVDENGDAHDASENTVNVIEMGYGSKLLAGRILYTIDAGFDEKPYAYFVVPVPANEEATEYIAAFIEPSYIEENFKEAPSYSSSFFVLTDYEHKSVYIAGKPGNLFLAEGSLWDNLRKFAKSQNDWNAFEKAYDSGEKNILEAYQAKITRNVTYTPVENTEWNLIIGYDSAYLKSEVKGFALPGKTFAIEIVIVLVAVLLTYTIVAIRVRNRSDTSSKELTGKAETDLLTGVLNKLATESKIKEYISANPDGQGTLILIDVDNFKKINDKMGHAFGDEVLRNLGLRLKTLYRATDIVGRIGGDEFVVFLKDISDMEIVEREARKLEIFFRDFEVGEYTKYSVNASLGATIYPVDGRSFEELYKNADDALYYVKQNGKNKLVFYKQDEKFPVDDIK